DIAAGSNVFMNMGGRAFAAPAPLDQGTALQPMAAGDFNGDGKIDLVGYAQCCAAIGMWPNEGGGKFGALVSFPTLGAPAALAAADIDGNGLADVVVSHGGIAVHLATCR